MVSLDSDSQDRYSAIEAEYKNLFGDCAHYNPFDMKACAVCVIAKDTVTKHVPKSAFKSSKLPAQDAIIHYIRAVELSSAVASYFSGTVTKDQLHQALILGINDNLVIINLLERISEMAGR